MCCYHWLLSSTSPDYILDDVEGCWHHAHLELSFVAIVEMMDWVPLIIPQNLNPHNLSENCEDFYTQGIKSWLEIWDYWFVSWLETRAGFWSIPQTTTRGQFTGFHPNSDNNSNNSYSIFTFPQAVSVLRQHRWSFLSTSALFHAAARCYVRQHLHRLFHLLGCKVIYLPVTSPRSAFPLTAPYHFGNFCILADPFLLFLIFW